jgi:hypothetical protein
VREHVQKTNGSCIFEVRHDSSASFWFRDSILINTNAFMLFELIHTITHVQTHTQHIPQSKNTCNINDMLPANNMNHVNEYLSCK